MNDPITFDVAYWQSRWLTGATQWDLSTVSPPLQAYTDQLTSLDLSILIPGCGNAYEAAYLLAKGFRNVTLLDIAPAPVERLRDRFGNDLRVLLEDFFDHQGQYDLILEQTFFCALAPTLRPAYARHMHRLLRPGGKLAGVLFDRDFAAAGPPFGGSQAEYRALFAPLFTIEVLAPCHNSARPRSGTECFFILRKP